MNISDDILAKLGVVLGADVTVMYVTDDIFVLKESRVDRRYAFDKDYNLLHKLDYCRQKKGGYFEVTRSGQKWDTVGLMDSRGNIVIPERSNAYGEIMDDYVIFIQRGKRGCIRISDNTVVIEPEYVELSFICKGFLSAKAEGNFANYGVLDVNGRIVLDFINSYICKVSDKYIGFQRLWLYGLYNTTNNTKTDLIFASVERLNENYCNVIYAGERCILDLNNMELLGLGMGFEEIQVFGDFFKIVKNDNTTGVINNKMEPILDFDEGYCEIDNENKRALMTYYKENKTAVLYEDGRIKTLQGIYKGRVVSGIGHIRDKKTYEHYVVNPITFEKLINESFNRIRCLDWSEGIFMCFKDSKARVYDRNLNLLTKKDYNDIEGVAVNYCIYGVKNEHGLWAVAVYENNVLEEKTDFIYKRVCLYDHDVKRIIAETRNGTQVLLDLNFKEISEEYCSIVRTSEKYYMVRDGATGLYGLINTDGKVAVQVKYKEIDIQWDGNTVKCLQENNRWRNYEIS